MRTLSRTRLAPASLLLGPCLLLPCFLSCASDRSSEEQTSAGARASTSRQDRTDTAARVVAEPTLSLERVFADPPLAGRPPLRTTLSPSGEVLTFLKPSAEDSEVTELWALALDDEGAAPRPLVRAKDLIDPALIKLSEEERMALERRRIGHKGITSWTFCGGDDALLFPLSGDLYHARLNAKQKAPEVRRLTTDGEAKLDPRCSPKGTYAAFVQDGDLYLLDVASGKQRRLTKRPKAVHDTLRFGVAEFIAQEEMGRYRGYWFSADERYLAYAEVDESAVSVKVRPFIFADKTEMFEQRYPAAGEANAKVTLHVRDLKTGADVVVHTPDEDGYLPRVDFFKDGRLAVQWQSRDQKRLVLLLGAAPRFTLRPVLFETDAAWVELHDDLRALPGGRLLWSSERSGRRQLYLLPADGGELQPLTHAAEPVTGVCGVDEERGVVLFTGASARGKQQQLYSVPLASEVRPAPITRVTQGDGWHEVTCGEGVLVDTYSRWATPPVVRLLRPTGELRQVLDDNPAEELRAQAAPKARWLTLSAEDGAALNALLLEPVLKSKAADSARSPLLVYTYGGPTANVVADRWTRQFPLFVHWAQRGFAILLVDNRGSAHRDRAFTRAFEDRFGVIEIADQESAVRQVLALEPWLDEERVGIFGWSYGGYVSVMALLDEETPFRAGAAVAPVTDWALYDTHYTERYLGTPEANAAVYARANALPRAKNLLAGERALLLAHGMADDNVLFAHTLQLAAALQDEGAVFRLMPYPGHAHGIRGQKAQLHVFKTITDFFEDELR